MKIQCSCGAKYSFEVTPESAAQPVRFVCPSCGLDSSAAVNDLIRREFPGQAAAAPPVVASTPPLAPPVPSGSRLRISREPEAAIVAPVSSTAELPAGAFCPKHPQEPATEKCAVCHKPICPKCMELFGYFCSPFCKSKATAENLKVPAYAGLASTVEAKFWLKTGRIIKAGVVLLLLLLGFGVWYGLFGSVPHPVFSVRFDQRALYGQSHHVDPDQLVFLHGGTLARYDLKTKSAVWSHELIDQKDVDDLVARMQAEESGGYHTSIDKLQKIARGDFESLLSLIVSGKNVWVGSRTKLIHYDWDTGKELQTIALGEARGTMIAGVDDVLLLRESDSGAKSITHVNYASGELRTAEFNGAGQLMASAAGHDSSGGLPSLNGEPSKPLDPSKIADEAQNLKTPGRLALPAILANNIHQQELMAEMQDSDPHRSKPAAAAARLPAEEVALVPSKYGFLQYSVKLLEQRTVMHEAMKAPPKNSVMNGELTAGQSTEAANEMLNEMQRSHGGDKVQEDVSRYQVTLHRSDSGDASEWSGEVAGFPAVYSLKTVNVIAAGKTVLVLDKTNKKLWESSLTYNVSGSHEGSRGEDSLTGQGPCVESGDTLYVIDQAVLTAFDLATGNARWRLPSVGIVGLFIDEQGMIYVNTTTANPDKIKYSRQIDIGESIDSILLKVDPKNGKNLWTSKTGGFAAYVSGPFIYTMQSHDVADDDPDNDMLASLQKPAMMKLFRVSTKDGHIIWEHDEDRSPLSVEFDKNVIYLVFHKEVQVLKYLVF